MADLGISDTSSDIAARQRERLRGASMAERVELIEQLCDATTAVALAGIDRQHPDATATERAQLLAARRYGSAFAQTALGRMLAP
ncbi:MAG: hypothetical protein KJO17_08650 [Acidimicrobiia bacterium]|nr:hypothetical protein [Acidimicrobiia bacterium]NNF68869.1 hypothetical protein [Acidimicrobiia bacterium]